MHLLPTILRFLGGLCMIVLLNACSHPADLPVSESPSGSGPWQLTFADEFNGDMVDTRYWSLRDPWGYERNNELQAYVPEAFSVKDGKLYIFAQEKPAHYDGEDRDYTSGMMSTYEKFTQKYGRFEIRFRAPAGKGLWPAFWLLPDPLSWPPEIDVFEILGHEPEVVHLTHHWADEDKEHQENGKHFRSPLSFAKEFHTVSAEWSPEEIVWEVNGVERFRSKADIPDQPMYMLLNLAVGGDWPGAPDENTVFPAALEVDYIRVYQRTGS